jgi:hypothetical protein
MSLNKHLNICLLSISFLNVAHNVDYNTHNLSRIHPLSSLTLIVGLSLDESKGRVQAFKIAIPRREDFHQANIYIYNLNPSLIFRVFERFDLR